MSDYKEGSFDAAKFKDVFGLVPLEDESKAYSKGSTTGTKQTGALGTYMTKDDYNRLKDSDDVWDAYAAVHGKDAMKKKRGGNEDGLSINALDALMDDLSVESKSDSDSDPTPDTGLGKSDEHVAAEKEYLSNFTDGNPWAAADPVKAYKRSFNDAKAIGQEFDSGYYMRRLSKDKLEGVNRFTDYLGDMNKLVAHEQNYAARKAINRVDELGAEPPSFEDPQELFEQYRDELKEDFD